MPLVRLVLCLTLLASGVGFAQAPEPGAASVPPSPSAPPLVEAPEPPEERSGHGPRFSREPEQQAGGPGYLVARLLLQPAGGVLIGAASGIAALFPMLLITTPFCLGAIIEGPRNKTCEAVIYGGAALGAAFGAGVIVQGLGKLLKGHGSFRWTLLGAPAGTVIGGTIALGTEAPEGTFMGLMVAGPAVGATIGFAASDHGPPEPAVPGARAGSRVNVLPMVSVTRAGGLMGGLVGRF